jgi:hypothetical protein
VNRFDGFNHAVRRFSDHRQPPWIVEGLNVMAVHVSGESSPGDLVNRAVPMLGRRLEIIREVLIQSAAGMKTEHLHSQTDSQYRHLRMQAFECVEELEFERLPHRIDEIGTGVDRFAEGGRVWIIPAAEDHAVEAGQNGGGRTRKRKEGDRDTTAFGDRSRVSASKAGLVLHEVGGYADEWKIVSGWCDAGDSQVRGWNRAEVLRDRRSGTATDLGVGSEPRFGVSYCPYFRWIARKLVQVGGFR